MMSVYNFNLEVITPVHIGMGKEKSYVKGFDYIYKNNEYTIYSQDKLLSSLDKKDIGAISGFLSSGKFHEFNEYLIHKNLLTDEMVLYKWQSDYESNDDIKRHIQDGLGHWIIPGSSIKGSIRGIILTHFYNKQHKSVNINESELLGGIENNLMRFIQISDCVLDTTPGIYPVKIFSADPQNRGQWKHNRIGGHSNDFKPTGFVTYYEMLNDGVDSDPTTGIFKFKWGATPYMFNKRKGEIPNMDELFSNNGEDDILSLIKMIKDHTNCFLKKEFKFFENFPNSALTTQTFFEELNWLQEQNNQNNKSCYLRLGANEGWHSITGNWRWHNFIDATEKNRNNFTGRIQKAYKTRKLVFDWDFDDDERRHRRFSLPGFVKITLSNDQ